MKDMSQLYKDFKFMSDQYKVLQKNTPRIAGTVAVKVMRENFAAQGFIEEGKTPQETWKPRDPRTDFAYDNYQRYKGINYKSSNPILKQTGNLRDAISYKVEGSKVWIGVNLTLVPYAKIHNEGGGNMPKRKYLGWSKHLAESIHENIVARSKKIFKKWATSTTG